VLELVASGDVDAAAGFYDRRAPSVREYFAQLCSSELVDEGTLATFVDFRGRAAQVPTDADAHEMLRRAARGAAAARLDLGDAPAAECRATAELLAARMNGELTRSEKPLERHLKRCATCRRTAGRLADADPALADAGGEAPPDHIRASWLELVGREDLAAVTEVEVPAEPAVAGENGTVAPVFVRARRGGLIGAARRLASLRRRHQ
jgi:hypothetical protein